MILGKPFLENSHVPWKQHYGRRSDGRQRVCAGIQEWIGGQAGLCASRAEVVFTYGWTGHRVLPINGEPTMQDGGDMNHRFLALTYVTYHGLRYLAERRKPAMAAPQSHEVRYGPLAAIRCDDSLAHDPSLGRVILVLLLENPVLMNQAPRPVSEASPDSAPGADRRLKRGSLYC